MLHIELWRFDAAETAPVGCSCHATSVSTTLNTPWKLCHCTDAIMELTCPVLVELLEDEFQDLGACFCLQKQRKRDREGYAHLLRVAFRLEYSCKNPSVQFIAWPWWRACWLILLARQHATWVRKYLAHQRHQTDKRLLVVYVLRTAPTSNVFIYSKERKKFYTSHCICCFFLLNWITSTQGLQHSFCGASSLKALRQYL